MHYYIIEVNTHPHKLTEIMNNLIQYGYKPLGGITVVIKEYTTYYIQSIINDEIKCDEGKKLCNEIITESIKKKNINLFKK